jgi:hypothetical protein
MWARINLIPLLQAEEDRDQVRRYLADQKREKELLGDNAKVYNSDRFVKSPCLSAGIISVWRCVCRCGNCVNVLADS